MFASRIRLIGLACCVALLAIWGRIAYLQLALGPYLRTTLSETVVRTRTIPAPRGSIRAADGTVLAIDRCDADLAVHYRYLERPLDDGWLATQARARLSRRARRDPARVEQAKHELRGEIEFMWQALAQLAGLDEAELDARARIIQRRVERVVESVNRRRRERWAQETGARAPGDFRSDPDDASATPVRDPSPLDRLRNWLSDPPERAPVEPRPVTVLEQSRSYTLVEDIPSQVLLEFTAHPERYPGVRLEQQIRRVYPERELACAVIGHIEPVPRAAGPDAEHPAALSSGLGRTGVEGFYELQMRGRPGEVREEVGARGGVPHVLGGRPPEPGRELVLTLDLALQRFAEQLLESPAAGGFDADGPAVSPPGAIVVLHVQTGAVLVGAAAPRFDLNVTARPTSEEARDLGERPDAPLYNRLAQMSLPPGSCFKPITAVAALEHGVDPRETYFCRGYLHEPDRFRCLAYRRYGVGHAAVTMTDALARSCNVYFFQLAEQIGADEIVRCARGFGFGERTGIDLAGEESGTLPKPDASGVHRMPGDALNVAIGQGAVSATPVQVAVMMAAIANGGLRVVPHVRHDAFQPPRFIDLGSPTLGRSLGVIRRGLEQVIADPRGTGHEHVYMHELAIAGKTGTAESGSASGDHAWFAGYAPAGDPEFAIVVVLEHAGSGGRAAGPLARELVQRMLQLGYFAPGGSHASP